MKPVTVLIPVHNEADNIAPLHAEISRELRALPHRVIVVDDGSTDDTAARLAVHAPEWTVISTPRVGKTRALQLGLQQVDAEHVVMMDGDLQDDTTAIPSLLADLEAGADCAVGCRARRRDGWLIKRFPSFFFNLWISLLFGFRFLDLNSGLKAFRTDILRRIVWFENCHRFLPLLVFRSGGRVAQRPVNHRPRHAGDAKFNSPLRFLGGFAQGLLLAAGWRSGLHPGRRLLRLAPLAVALLASAWSFHWVSVEWYFANYDAGAFVPHMVRYAQDGQLINTYYPSAVAWDPLGIGRQVGHGFLPSIVVGALSPSATYSAVHYTLCALAALGLLVYVRLLSRLLTPATGRETPAILLQCLAVVLAAKILVNLDGRPEVWVWTVACVALWVFVSTGRIGRLLTFGVTLSVLAVSHPVAALLTGLVFIGYLAVAHPGAAAAIKAWLVTAGATVTGLGLWFFIYPYPFTDWIEGNLRHAGASVVGHGRISLAPWLWHPAHEWRGLLFFIATAGALLALWRLRRRVSHPLLLAAAVAAFAGSVWYFSLRQGFPIYNIDWSTPLALLAGLSIVVHGGRRSSVPMALLTGMLILPAITYAYEQHVRQARLQTGPSTTEIRTLLLKVQDASPGTLVQTSRQYFHLLENTGRLRNISKYYHSSIDTNAGYILLAQADVRREHPPADLAGWRLLHHNYTGTQSRAIARGLHYALFIREDLTPSRELSALLTRLQAGSNDSTASNQ